MSEAARITLADVADFRLGDLLVKPSTRQILRDGGMAETVEPRVMQVLIALARAQGKVVGRDELTASCWDDRIVGEDAINRVISRLRRISEGIGRDSFRVETITKVGYRLNVERSAAGVEPAAPPPGARASRPGRARWRLPALAGAALLLLAGLIAAYLAIDRSRASARDPLPRDRTAAALFLKARDDLAQRTQASLAQSVDELTRVTQIAPDFAPAFASLADAYLLEQEAGSLPNEVAFARAEQAAGRARRLDADLPAVYRALGFIAYWRDGDRATTGAMFHRALSNGGDDALTHFWFANILADNGQDAAAFREFDRARLLDPGSENIAADLAWANWSAGRDAIAKTQLNALVAEYPDNVEAHDCLSTVLLAEGDYGGFLDQFLIRARLRGEPGLLAEAARLKAVMAQSGTAGFQAELLQRAMQAQDGIPNPNHAEAAFIASLANDRAALASILALAGRNHEQWGSAGYTLRIAARWRADGQITALLSQLRAPPIT